MNHKNQPQFREGRLVTLHHAATILGMILEAVNAGLDRPSQIGAIVSQFERYRSGEVEVLTFRVGHLGKVARAAGMALTERGCAAAKVGCSMNGPEIGEVLVAAAEIHGGLAQLASWGIRLSINPDGLRGAEISFGRAAAPAIAPEPQDQPR